MSDANSTPAPPAAQLEYRIRDVPELPGYRVDTYGQVWSNRYNCRRQAPYDPATTYRLLKPTPRPSGHLMVDVQHDDKCRRNRTVHRLVLETFIGPCPPKMECRHLDGNPANNRLDNLVWGTRKENMRDRTYHGADNAGERNHRARLSNAQVREIRQRYAAGGLKQADLAAAYGVSIPAISTVVTGKSYAEAGGSVSTPKTIADLVRHNIKLTDAQLDEIYRRSCQPGIRGKDLAAEYGVSRSTISRICHGNQRRIN